MRKIIGLLLISMVIAGCAATGGGPDRSGTAALECGVVGAGGGFLACKLLGGSDAMCAGIAAGAATVGGGVCYGFASNYEKRRKELAGKENDLDARLTYVQGLNEDSEKLNRELNARVDEISQHTDRTVEQIQQGTISSQQLAKERETLLKEETAAKEQVVVQEAALADMKRFQAEQLHKTSGVEDKALHAELDAEIQKQERLLEETKRTTTAFASQRQRI
ncbi:MAG: hypothetical protein H0X43_07725 [Nitrosospira sp.]|nr:hypothetical protein [Nitrosospira sp.]